MKTQPQKLKLSSVYGEFGKPLSLYDIIDHFQNYNEEHNNTYGFSSNAPTISAVIVYAQSNFTQEYSEASRSYRVTNLSGKRFFNGMMGGSIYGDSLDGTDLGVRLDAYDWKIERCYFE